MAGWMVRTTPQNHFHILVMTIPFIPHIFVCSKQNDDSLVQLKIDYIQKVVTK